MMNAVDASVVKKKSATKKTKKAPKAKKQSGLTPLIKFAGGKRWLVDQYEGLLPLPSDVRVYYEPFVGGGAVATHYLGKASVVLGDMNTRLMAMYRGVRNEVGGVVQCLRGLVYDRDMFAGVRADFNDGDGRWNGATDAQRAAWFIYLNRTCFNGLYRENKSGAFNVPFGRYDNPLICDEKNLLAWNRIFAAKDSFLVTGDFKACVEDAGEGDFVFLDPPYVPVNETTSDFTEYQAGGFGPADQARLVALLHELHERGAKFLLTNSEKAKSLYENEPWHMRTVKASRNVNSKANKRGKVVEIMVANFPLVEREKTLAEAFA